MAKPSGVRDSGASKAKVVKRPTKAAKARKPVPIPKAKAAPKKTAATKAAPKKTAATEAAAPKTPTPKKAAAPKTPTPKKAAAPKTLTPKKATAPKTPTPKKAAPVPVPRPTSAHCYATRANTNVKLETEELKPTPRKRKAPPKKAKAAVPLSPQAFFEGTHKANSSQKVAPDGKYRSAPKSWPQVKEKK
ncbi:hypothetical protein B0T26DRAFT_748006 [Lasiosphaeria miniovina]|uniref:Histone H1 n=1 Tax=Lasiosphaeria miniovina TaxID=1954250 RepID=A0AA40B4U7_9PEZI|nr:uncharacterized protein B0T26DRAFT_748006 [Lasiosphaeria miniovina]KAK0727695.1 hypothetical protein B0T26DRAFT_748006 [Lasiosphaeria miniovina]